MKVVEKINILGALLIFLAVINCSEPGKKNAISELVPLALTSGGSSYTEPNDGGKSVSSYNNTDTQITLPNFTVSTSINCSIEAGKPAAVCLVSPTNVDRYKNIEIIFNESMNRKSVKAAFSLVGSVSGAIPSPGGMDIDDTDIPDKGGRFTWLSGRRLIFDPYRELKANETYTLTINNTAKNQGDQAIATFSYSFTTEHDYLITNTVNSVALGGANNNDITFNKSANLLLNSSFTNVTGAFSNIQKITLNRLSTAANYEVCSGSCSSLPAGFNLNTSAVPPQEGGNTYFYEITTKDTKVYRRFFTFNWGNVQDASGLLPQIATGVLDEGIMMKLLGQIVERFVKGDFKVKDATVNKTFNEFAGQPTSSTKRTSHCINYGSFSFIRSYGDSGTANGDGYCGGAGENPGAFVGNACFLGCSDFDMDVYISGVSIPGVTDGQNSVAAALKANTTDELGIDLYGRKAYINLTIIARNRSSMGAWLIGSGNRFHFSTSVELNKSPTPTNLRLSRSKNSISVDSTGKIILSVKPFTRGNQNDPNFTMAEWDGNLTVAGMNYIDSTSWAADLLSPITEMIADSMVPQVRPQIVHSMLEDIIEKIAPNVLNAVLGSLQTPGITIKLPNYLPAPLADAPLNVKLKLQSDAQVRLSGSNKGLVSSIDTGIVHGSPLAPASQRIQSREQGIVYFKPAGALPNTYPFSQIGANPGMLLSLHPDAVTQAAYHLWKNRVIDLNMNEAFIDQINTYAGANDLFKLTKTLLQAAPIISIIAPGRTTLVGIKGTSSYTRLPPMGDTDPITFVLEPIFAPVIKMIPGTSGSSVPKIKANFSELQLTITGKRTSNASYPCDANLPISGRDTTNNCYYTVSTVRVSVSADAVFGFKTFSNPTNNATMQNLNALYVELDPNNNFYYSLDVLEGASFNPYGLDPNAIRSVVDPLVKSLVVPLVNNILKEVPLPDKIDFPALVDKNAGASGGTSCKLNVKTTGGALSTVPTPVAEQQYILNKLTLQGAFATNPGTLVECP